MEVYIQPGNSQHIYIDTVDLKGPHRDRFVQRVDESYSVEHGSQGVGSHISGTYLDRSPFQMSYKLQRHPWPFLGVLPKYRIKTSISWDGQLIGGSSPTIVIM